MKRRDLAAAACGLLGAGVDVRAQTPRPAGKIAYLHPRTIAPNHATLSLLRPAWTRLGYVEGESVLLRSADGDTSRVPGLVNDVVARGAGVIIVVGAAAVRAASQATKTVPIVAIDLETDPVNAGYAASFARPGGNVTGLFLDQPALAGKWIDLLLEAAPEVERLALLWDRGTGVDQLEVARSVARNRGFDARVLEMGAIGDFDAGLRGLAGKPRTGIVTMTQPGLQVVAGSVAAAAQKHRLPTIGFLRIYAQAGMLLSYGPVQEAYFPRAVGVADKILRGARPGDVPIEGPDRFEMVINQRTARAIGVKVPQGLLLRADEVIE